jgi:hypothetical protein
VPHSIILKVANSDYTLSDGRQVISGLVHPRQHLPNFHGRFEGGLGSGGYPVWLADDRRAVHHLRAVQRETCVLMGVHHRQGTRLNHLFANGLLFFGFYHFANGQIQFSDDGGRHVLYFAVAY